MCLDGFEPYSKIHAHASVVFASLESLLDTLTTKIVHSLVTAYGSAPDPNHIKGLIISNPHNPFGRCYPLEVLQALMAFCQERELYFVVDKVYALSEFGNDEAGGVPFVSALVANSLLLNSKSAGIESHHILDPSRLLVIYSMSKDFGSSGMRIACTSHIVLLLYPLSLHKLALQLIVDRVQGCIISQANPTFLRGVALATYWQTSVLSSLYIRHLLESDELSNVIVRNRQRLAKAYQLLAAVLDRYGVDFIKPTAGVFVFARIAPHATSWEEESEVVRDLQKAGVRVGQGKAYLAKPGWARITFALPETVLVEALRRLEDGLIKVRRLR